MKRILFILHTPPPVHGASVVGAYIKNSELINTAFSCRYINLGTSRTVDEIGKNPLAKVGRYVSILFRELWQLVVFRPHTVYLTISAGGAGFYKDFPIAMLAGLLGAKRVYHFHNKGISARRSHQPDDLLCRMVFYKAEVILLSKYLYYDIAPYVPESRVSYCANGVGSEAVSSEQQAGSSKQQVVSSKQQVVSSEQQAVSSKQQAGSSEQQAVSGKQQAVSGKQQAVSGVRTEILFLSNLIESKGLYVLLDACALLQHKGLHFSCSLVGGEGDVSVEELSRQIDERKLNSCVTYKGKLYGSEKEAILKQSDIFTLATFYSNECMPLVILEAMQHGLAVVSTTEGAIPEIVNDGVTGYLVPGKDAAALADKLELLIRDKELCKKMGQEGRRRYEAEYTLTAFEQRMIKILDRC